MHILMISDVYFPRINGVSTSLAVFRHELMTRGHRVTLVAPAYPEPWDDDDNLVRIPSHYLVFDPEDRILRPGALRACLAEHDIDPPDLVHIHTPFIAHYAGLGLAREWGVPTIETYHTFFEDYLHHYLPFVPRGLLRRFARSISRNQCNAVDHVIAPSHALIDVLERYGVEKPITRLPTGIDLSELAPGDGAAFRARYGLHPDQPILLHVARVAFEKNIKFLLEAHARVRESRPDTILVIAGDGPARRSLERHAKRLKIADSVCWTGYLDRTSTLLDAYAAATIFVFASKTETQGLVLLEAMAKKLPVVSLAHLGTRDILVTESDAIVPPDNAPQFAQELIALLDDPARRQRMGDAHRRWAQQWSIARKTNNLEQLYANVRDAHRRDDVAISS
ncbi:MAG: glycosyltransferase [Thioalkalivibrionaceae bacterium]